MSLCIFKKCPWKACISPKWKKCSLEHQQRVGSGLLGQKGLHPDPGVGGRGDWGRARKSLWNVVGRGNGTRAYKRQRLFLPAPQIFLRDSIPPVHAVWGGLTLSLTLELHHWLAQRGALGLRQANSRVQSQNPGWRLWGLDLSLLRPAGSHPTSTRE